MLLVYYLSGVSGLIYQIVWLRLLAEIFGNSTYALSTILAAFMAGLALGSWQGGTRISKSSNVIHLYIRLELGIAVSAFLVTVLFVNYSGWYAPFYSQLQHHLFLLTIIQFIVCFLLVAIPTALMGATVPTMAHIIITRLQSIGHDFSAMYALNTLGGMTGVVFTSFLLLEHFGLYNTVGIAVSINLLIGLGVLFLFGRGNEDDITITNDNKDSSLPLRSTPSLKMWIIPIVGFSTGFIAFALEILWTRSLVFHIGNTTYSFALILLMILFGIAAGSFLVQRFADRIQNKWNWVIGVLVLVAIGVFTSIPLFHTVFRGSTFTPDLNTWGVYLVQNLFKTALVVLIPSFGMGLTFPLLNALYIESINVVGKKVGTLYAWNTLGSILGSILTGFLLIPLFGISASIAGTGIMLLSVSVFIVWHTYSSLIPKFRFQLSWILVITLVGSWYQIVAKTEYPEFRSYDENDIEEVLYYGEGVAATTTIYLTKEKEKKMTVDGVLMGGDFPKAMRKQIMLADLPLLLRPDADMIYVVGLGTGITFQEFHTQKPNAQVVCAEISASVMRGSQLFQALSTRADSEPNVHLYFEDGKNYLKFHPQHYDIISSDTMLKKGSAGNSVMYSEEYYTLCRDKLTEDGIFIQWVPLYLSPEIHQVILNTIRDVFPHTSLWYVGDEALVHISSRQPLKLDFSTLEQTFESEMLKTSFEQIGINSLESMLSTFLMGDTLIDSIINTGLVNSVVHPIVEFKTPRELTINPYALVIENLVNLVESAQPISLSDQVLTTKNVNPEDKDRLLLYSTNFHSIMTGLMYSYAGKTKAAKQLIASVLASNPEDSNARHYLGLSDTYPDDHIKARNLLEAGIVLREMKADSLALTMIHRNLDLNPGNLLAMNEEALIYSSMGDLDQAISVAKKMISVDPSNALFHFNLGYYQEISGKYSDALGEYQKAKSLDPKMTTIDRRIQIVEELLGRFD